MHDPGSGSESLNYDQFDEEPTSEGQQAIKASLGYGFTNGALYDQDISRPGSSSRKLTSTRESIISLTDSSWSTFMDDNTNKPNSISKVDLDDEEIIDPTDMSTTSPVKSNKNLFKSFTSKCKNLYKHKKRPNKTPIFSKERRRSRIKKGTKRTTIQKIGIGDISDLSKIGSGSFGDVYVGTYLGTKVAVKMADTNKKMTKSKMHDLLEEAETMASIP
eukprot:UN31635